MRAHDDQIDSALRKQGIRVTQARRSVYEMLHEATEPLPAAEIDAALQQRGIAIDLVTVYRTLETLERCGLICRIDRLQEGWRYGVRSKMHHHSIICSACGSRSPLESCDLKRIEESLGESTGFSNISHSLQFYGTCPNCQH